MGQVGGGPESKKANEHVPQHAYHLVVPTDQQQPDESQPERHDQPAGADAGQDADAGRPGLNVGRDGDHVDDHHRHDKYPGCASAVPLQSQRLQVAPRHRADLGGNGLNHSEQGGDQQGQPGQLVARPSPDGDRRADVGRVVVRRSR